MTRTKFIKQISLGVVFCVFAAIAPRGANAQDDLQSASEAIRHQKRIYIEKVMELTPQEEDAFWRLYAEYDSGLAKIAEKRITLATNFIASQGTLSDAKALAMLQSLRTAQHGRETPEQEESEQTKQPTGEFSA